jgi:pyruvate/2-oxoacid:ferredoxin oxidoreductase alpha subunit
MVTNTDQMGRSVKMQEVSAEAHEKRLRKIKTLEDATPEPTLYGNPDAKITLVGF